MSSDPLLRYRRSAAQLHALAEVERTIRTTDTSGRRRYLRDFSEAFQSYRRVLISRDIEHRLLDANVILVGDYHALPASQLYTAGLLEILAATGRKVILGVEAIAARDQHILDEWQAGEIDTEELRSRVRFDADWGYAWQPFCDLLTRACGAQVQVFGLDCMPRHDMRSIRSRDRHAAAKITELRRAHPDAVLVVLFGESHLAPNHLPHLLRALHPRDRVLTVLQNVDSLYWLSAGEPEDLVEAVEVCDDVICVFSATPLEKYENYRLSIDRWKQQRAGRLDLAPSFYNLITSLLQFLRVDPYSTRRGETHAFMIDELPEVWSFANDEHFDRTVARRLNSQKDEVCRVVKARGSYFVADRNVIVAREYRMPWAAEMASRFVYQACRGMFPGDMSKEDSFFAGVLEFALAFLGSKILCPGRKLFPESEVFEPPDNGPEASRLMGHALGSDLYSAYVKGEVGKRWLRSLFFKDISKAGAARTLYQRIAQKVSSSHGVAANGKLNRSHES